MIVQDRLFVTFGKDRLMELDYDSLDTIREVKLPSGHIRLPLLPLPDGRMLVYGWIGGYSTIGLDDAQATSLDVQGAGMVNQSDQGVLRSDGAVIASNTNVRLYRWWPPISGPELWEPYSSLDVPQVPVVGDDDEAWTLSRRGEGVPTAGTPGTILLTAYREGKTPEGAAVLAATRQPELATVSPDDLMVAYTYPVVPREGQVMFVTTHGIFSAAVPGLRPPNPTYWATAQGNQARDRRWRPPVPVPASVGGVPMR